jgi:Cytosine/adenosine deaminases
MTEEVTEADLRHLRRCVELATEAVEAGDFPFGSVLVAADGTVLAEDRNREVTTGDPTRHPEFALARWAATNMTPPDRAPATVYTSGEHCPMCAAAHGWAGLGRIVYATSSQQLGTGLPTWESARPGSCPGDHAGGSRTRGGGPGPGASGAGTRPAPQIPLA